LVRTRAALQGAASYCREVRWKEFQNASIAADVNLNECIRRACAPAEEALSLAKRLYELHSSENTARELASAETVVKKCTKIWESPQTPAADQE
jgi:hypothetical protein